MTAVTADDGPGAGTSDAGTTRAGRPRAELIGWALLALYVVVLIAGSWQRWGDPVSDVGLDLTVGAHWADGLVPYRDIRYWYGPLGIGTLTAAFKVFGASLTTAWAVGFVVTGGIAELGRRLARRWLAPLPALGVMAVILSIAFSGTLFDYVLPHTYAATTGLLALFAAMLALSHRRFGLAGIAVAACALARPEFLAFAIAAVGGAALGEVREGGWRPAVLGVLRAAAVALVITIPPYLWLASLAGAHRLFLENIWPVEFLKAVGPTFEHDQHPFDLPSLGTLLVRGAVWIGGTWITLRLLALVLPADPSAPAAPTTGWWLRTGRVVGVLAGTIVVGLALAVVGGDAGEPLRLVKADTTRLLIAMTPLSALGLATLGWGAVAWLRGERSPLEEPEAGGPGWTAAGALLAVAGACSLRSYAQFSTDFYAAYYAAPVIVVAGILVVRLARRTGPRPELAGAIILALAAMSLSVHAVLGMYADESVTVPSRAGSFKTGVDGGANIRDVVKELDARVPPGDRLLSLPQEAGFLFLTKTKPALYDASFLPGVLAKPADDEAAARTLIDGSPHGPVPGYTPPRYAVEGIWNFKRWGFTAQGVDVNVALHRALTDHYRVIGRFGDTEHLPSLYSIGHAFVLYQLKDSAP